MSAGDQPNHTIRCNDALWKRFRLAALEDGLSLSTELDTLLNMRESQAHRHGSQT